MASRFRTRLFTFSSGDPVSLSSVISSGHDEYFNTALLRAGKANVGDIEWEDKDGESGGYLEAKEAIVFDLVAYIKASEIFLTGTASDTVYVTVLG